MEQAMLWLQGSWNSQDALWQLRSLLFIQISLKTLADCHPLYPGGTWPNQRSCLHIVKKIPYLQMLWWLPGAIFLLCLGRYLYFSILYVKYNLVNWFHGPFLAFRALIPSVAPMMDCTDNHYRTLARLITKHAWLYTEMLAAETIVYQKDNLVS